MHSFAHRHFIPHSPEHLWGVLLDLPTWGAWNTLRARAPLGIAPGRPLLLKLPLGPTRILAMASFVRVEPSRALVWKGGVRGIFFAEHGFVLDPKPQGTEVLHFETFEGRLVSPWLRRIAADQAATYRTVNLALASACSNRQAT